MATILVVEDHPDTAELMRLFVIAAGYQAVVVHSLQDAFKACESVQFDLLLADIRLGDGDSHELMSQMRDRCGLRGIAVTANAYPIDREKSLKAGFCFHLNKPVSIDALTAAIKACLDDRTDLEPPRGQPSELP